MSEAIETPPALLEQIENVKSRINSIPDPIPIVVGLLARRSFQSLRDTLENNDIPEVQWPNPFMETGLSVNWDWDEGRMLYTQVPDGGIPPGKEGEELLSSIMMQDQILIVLQTLTNHSALVVREGLHTSAFLLPEVVTEIQALPLDKRNKAIEERMRPFCIGHPPLRHWSYEGQDSEAAAGPEVRTNEEPKPLVYDVDGKTGNILPFIQFCPLVINEDTRKANYPILVGLRFFPDNESDPGPFPSDWPIEEQEGLWQEVFRIFTPPQSKPGQETTGAAEAPPTKNGTLYPVHTGQEYDEIMSAAADGRSLQYYKHNEQAGTLSHVRPNAPHYTRLSLTPEELEDGKQSIDLERLVKEQDADCAFALLYVSSVLAPAAPLPANAYAGGWIGLDDVLEKVYGPPRTTNEREELRKKVWNFLLFGARASVHGKRSIPYIHPDTGEAIDTEIDSPLWSFMGKERPIQPGFWPSQEVPLRVEIVVSKGWTHVTTSPHTAQYLPLGELLGSIPPNQPSGAWARVIGLALANFWRRHPQETISGDLRPTRRELLEHYTPKIKPPSEVLNGGHPRRAIEFWHGALETLVSNGYLARHGESDRLLDEAKKSGPRKNWKEAWLNEPVDLLPGPKMKDAVQVCADALPVNRPRHLGAKKRKPRKPRTPDAGKE